MEVYFFSYLICQAVCLLILGLFHLISHFNLIPHGEKFEVCFYWQVSLALVIMFFLLGIFLFFKQLNIW